MTIGTSLDRPVRSKATWLSAGIGMALLLCGLQQPAFAQSPFVTIVSGNNGELSVTAHNLQTDTNGAITYSNGLVGSFSSAYDLGTHVFGTISTPTNTGYTTTPVVTTDATIIAATGQVAIVAQNGTTLQSLTVASYNTETTANTDAVGYYKYDLALTIPSASGTPYQITGFADSHGEVQDVILDYGIDATTGAQTGTVLNLSAINGTEVRTTTNAKSNAQFSSAPSTTLSGAHTVSILYYNSLGPASISFGVSAQAATPEPTSLTLLFAGAFLLLGTAQAFARRSRPAL